MMRLKLLAPFSMLLLTAVCISVKSQGQTYFVATDGNDTYPGTETMPFRTIRKGVTVLTPGATLYIKSGTYAEALQSSDTVPGGTSWSAPVTIAAYPGARVIMRPTSAGNVIGLASPARQYIVFDGLVLDAVNTPFTSSVWGTGIYVGDGASHIRFKNTEVLNAPGQGILVGGATSGANEFLNMSVHDNGRVDNLTHGFYLANGSNLVDHCVIYNNAAWGITVYSGSGNRPSDNIIRGNTIYSNARIAAHGGGIDISSGDRNIAYNNVIRNHPSIPVYVAWGSPANTKLFNNTIVDQYGIYIHTDSSGATVLNNIVYGANATIDNRGVGTTVSNNLLTDPKFVNAVAFDFRLQSGSPAIDSGATVADVAVDFNGIRRPQGLRYDIGAYEYTGGLAPPSNVRIVPQ